MPDIDQYIERLQVCNPLRDQIVGPAIQALHLPEGSRGLDAGCGVGLQAVLLAEAVGPDGHVTGLDVRPEFLAQAERVAEEAGLAERISFRQGDVNKLPFDDDAFDWVWSASCVGYPAAEPLPLLRELVRVARPGGRVAILVWSSQMLLPGYPLLEARLNATGAGIAPFTRSMRPDSHWLRALGWFRDAGLQELKAQTLLGDVHAPMSDDMREALIALLEMRWDGAQSEVTPEDWAEYQRLSQPESPDFILDRPDYYAFFTESLFHGKVAK